MFTFTVQPKATQEAVRALWYFQSAGLAELWKQRREAIRHLSKALHWGFFWVWALQAACGTAGPAHLWVLHVVGSANYSVILKEKHPVKSNNKGTTKQNSQFTLSSTDLPCRANLCSGASSHQCTKVGKHLPVISNYHSDAAPSLTNKLRSICIDRRSTKAPICNLSSSLSPLREKPLLSLPVLCHYQQLLHSAVAPVLTPQAGLLPQFHASTTANCNSRSQTVI